METSNHRHRRTSGRLGLAALALAAASAQAAGPDAAKGLWLSADKTAIVEFANCADDAAALCGGIVWEKEAGDCGTKVVRLAVFDDDAWRKGWVYDPRTKKYYKGSLRVAGDTLLLRAYIGTELLGETEEMSRVPTLPNRCHIAHK